MQPIATPILLTDSAVSFTTGHTFVVPKGQIWQIISIQFALTSSGTAGNRQVEVQIVDGAGNVIARSLAGAVQATGLTRKYLFSVVGPELAAFVDTDYISCVLNGVYLQAGHSIKIIDNKAVDNADTATTNIVALESAS